MNTNLPTTTPSSAGSDQALLRSFAEQQQNSAFTELVRRYLPLVMAAALRRLKSRPLAEEAAQNAFARLAKKARSVPADRLAAWLHRTAVLEASNLARSEARFASHVPLEDAPEPLSLSLESPMKQSPIFDQLDSALQELSETDRELVLRRYTFGETVKEMAARVGKSEEACQKRLERTLARLGAKLGTATGLVVALQNLAATPAQAVEGAVVHKIAAGALQKASGPVVDSVWGTAAACLAAAGMASALAWPQAAISHPEVASGNAAMPAPISAVAKTTEKPLKPRPAKIMRRFVDVLDSIHCGRLLPLVEYLPQATEADLRAILREDDMASLSERSMARITAHELAMQHWAHLDPVGAWKYALGRDADNNGSGLPLTALVFSRWAKTDEAMAWQAVAALFAYDRLHLAECLPSQEPELAEQFIFRYPEVYWDVQRVLAMYPSPEQQLANARKAVDAAMTGGKKTEGWDLANGLLLLTEGDAEAAISQAHALPDPALREQTLATIVRQHLESVDPSTLPMGPVKCKALQAQYLKTNAAMPKEPMLQKAWLEAMGPKFALSDPFFVLNNLAAAELGALTVTPTQADDDYDDSDFNWLETTVQAAAAKDAQATEALLPRLKRNLEPYVAKNLADILKSAPEEN